MLVEAIIDVCVELPQVTVGAVIFCTFAALITEGSSAFFLQAKKTRIARTIEPSTENLKIFITVVLRLLNVINSRWTNSQKWVQP